METQTVSVQLQADPVWIPLVHGIAEQSSLVFGLHREQSLRLRMAAEEILSYLATQAPHATLTLVLSAAPSHVRLEFSFPAQNIDLWAMNITTGGVDSDEDALPIIGLVLAARMSSSFEIHRDGQNIHLLLRIARTYPQVDAPVRPRFAPHGSSQVVHDPSPELLKEACLLARAQYPQAVIPQSFTTPGLVVDQIAGGEQSVLLTMDAHNLTGLLLWEQRSASSASFCGPYIFCQDSGETAHLLTETLVQTMARTSCTALLSTLATADLPATSFEALGSLSMANSTGAVHELTVWFRSLREDEGLSVWSHPDLEPFLRHAYAQLVLMREVHPAIHQGEYSSPRSVISTQLRHETSEAILLPMLDGQDMRQNIHEHARVLRAEGYHNIFIHLDLSLGWHGALVPGILANNFTPRLVLPYASRSDLVVFQHVGY